MRHVHKQRHTHRVSPPHVSVLLVILLTFDIPTLKFLAAHPPSHFLRKGSNSAFSSKADHLSQGVGETGR